MLRILLLFFLLFTTLFITKPAFAATTVTSSPNPLYSDSGSVTITVESDQDIFNPQLQYASSIYRPTADIKCFSNNNQLKPESSKKYSITWTLVGCRAAPDPQWKFELCLGGNTQKECNSKIAEYTYTLRQAGGGTLGLSAANSPLQVGNKPKVVLVNAREGQTYSLWWDGAKVSFAKKYTPKGLSSPDGNITIDLDENEVDYKKPGVKKLCMGVGDYLLPSGCTYSETFDFQPTAPPTNPSCSIDPNPAYINDTISIKGNYLPKSVALIADIKDSSGNNALIANSSVVNSDSTGFINITLFKKDSNIKVDTYTTRLYVYPQQNNAQPVCPPVSFRVTGNLNEAGKNPAGKATVQCTGANCTSAAGQLCDGDKGIATAIGCIPTNPADFINALFKFGLGIGGGIAFLLMVFGAIEMITSAGNPESLKAGQERFTNAIIGILFIVFSVLLLQIIGVDILSIFPKS